MSPRKFNLKNKKINYHGGGGSACTTAFKKVKNLFGKVFLKVKPCFSPVSTTPCWLTWGPLNTPCTPSPLSLVLISHLSLSSSPSAQILAGLQDPAEMLPVKPLLSALIERTFPSRNSFHNYFFKIHLSMNYALSYGIASTATLNW